jgi:hypothetical protein
MINNSEAERMTVKYFLTLDHLKNNEKVTRKLFYTSNSAFVIVNYDKNYLCFDDKKNFLYRSVVFSLNDTVVCFSPPKTLTPELFIKENPVVNIYVNEMIEGVMINLFFDNNLNQWFISTKKSIGGKYWFYGKKSDSKTTFFQMFMEALRASPNDSLNNVEILNYLPKNYCYNFVLQHPSNIITMPVDKPRLYLISVYEINKNIVQYIPAPVYQNWSTFRNIEGVIEFPKEHIIQSYSELFHQYEYNKKLLPIGYMITNTLTGERMKIMNDRFEKLKKTLHIKPTVQYQFLCIYRIARNKIDEYITLFPSMKKEFLLLRNDYEDFMRTVHRAYVDVYVRKYTNKMDEKYSSHIFKIHKEIYLPSLKMGNPVRITYQHVFEYFSKMEPRELLYLLNWDKRKLNL